MMTCLLAGPERCPCCLRCCCCSSTLSRWCCSSRSRCCRCSSCWYASWPASHSCCASQGQEPWGCAPGCRVPNASLTWHVLGPETSLLLCQAGCRAPEGQLLVLGTCRPRPCGTEGVCWGVYGCLLVSTAELPAELRLDWRAARMLCHCWAGLGGAATAASCSSAGLRLARAAQRWERSAPAVSCR